MEVPELTCHQHTTPRSPFSRWLCEMLTLEQRGDSPPRQASPIASSFPHSHSQGQQKGRCTRAEGSESVCKRTCTTLLRPQQNMSECPGTAHGRHNPSSPPCSRFSRSQFPECKVVAKTPCGHRSQGAHFLPGADVFLAPSPPQELVATIYCNLCRKHSHTPQRVRGKITAGSRRLYSVVYTCIPLYTHCGTR